MSDGSANTVVNLEAKQAALRDAFLGWQCRLRQLAMRQAEGRPTGGMRPEVTLAGQAEPLGQITVLVHKAEPAEDTAQFRHMVLKTHDPAERRKSALQFLQSAHYQRSKDFSDVLTALFGPESKAARQLSEIGSCRLDFAQYNQRYSLPCRVRALAAQEAGYQATFWHNSLFNPSLPASVTVLAFAPDWAHATAEPPVS